MTADVTFAKRVQADELLQIVAAELAVAGVRVGRPFGKDGRRLVVCFAAQFALSARDGVVEYGIRPLPGPRPGPKSVADLASAFLTEAAGDFPRLGQGYKEDDLTFKGVVGWELQARGMRVGLEAHEDDVRLNADSVVVATNPEAVIPATVHVRDDGSLTWAFDCMDFSATASRSRGGYVRSGEPAALAEVVAARVTAAISQASRTNRMRPR